MEEKKSVEVVSSLFIIIHEQSRRDRINSIICLRFLFIFNFDYSQFNKTSFFYRYFCAPTVGKAVK